MILPLVFFLVFVIYGGDFTERVLYTMFFFVIGAVLIARISIQLGRNRAMMYTVALGDRKLYVVDTATKTINSYQLPAPSSLTGTLTDRLGDLRPFSVSYYRGSIYVGAVNTAEPDVTGSVWSW